MKYKIILFWSTWDLVKRKLYNSFFNLYKKWIDIEILNIWRKNWNKNDFLDYFDKEIKEFIPNFDGKKFLDRLDYLKIDIDDTNSYKSILSKLKKDRENIFYLSIWAEFFEQIVDWIWSLKVKKSKIVFEKPFWNDLNTAISLNNHISKYFKEEQIYRLDHYLWKYAVFNILNLRFSNFIFEKLWNNKNIDNIKVISNETLWVEKRWDFYDKTWAIRDMMQNHLFQMLSLIIMDKPKSLFYKDILNKKSKVFDNFFIPKDFSNIVLGQYIWYKDELWVDKNSKTETFVALKICLQKWKLSNIPIFLQTWKYLNEKSTKIIVEFKENNNNLFEKNSICKNKIIIDIFPTESISIEFNITWNDKKPKKVVSRFEKEIWKNNWYEKLIEDIILWDKTLFPDFNFIKKSWKIVDDLVNCKDNCPILHLYEKWSNWPEIINNLLLWK